MKKSSRAIGVGVALSFLLAFAPVTPALAAAGAVWTNTGPCGSPQNVNQYEVNQTFYGHGSNFTPNKSYDWVVKAPGANGAVKASGSITTDADGHFCEALFLVSSGMIGGPYQFQVGTAKNDNFKIIQGTTPPPPPSACLVPNTLGDLEPFVFGSSGEPTVQQIFTFNGFTTNVLTDQMNYQVWNLGVPGATTVSFKVSVIGKQAAFSETFGWYKTGQAGTFVPLFTQSAWTMGGADPAAIVNVPVTLSAADAAAIGFAIKPSDGSSWYTEKALNTAGKDAAAAYNPADGTYLLAFEDIYAFDNDYNDLVVKIHDITCQ